MNKWLSWNTRSLEKEKESSELDMASCHSVPSQKVALNLSSNSELSIMNVVRPETWGIQGC